MSRTVIVTPFGVPQQLAAACVLSDIPGVVVPLGQFSAVVQEGTDIAAGNAAAAAISTIAGKHEVLLMVRSEERIDAAHYRHGEREADVPAGLALSNLPDELEPLLLESLEPTDVEGHIDTSTMSKIQASSLTMTPQRAAIARTALMWAVALLLALVALVGGGIALGNGAVLVGGLVLLMALVVGGFAGYRLWSLLVRARTAVAA
ncbi:hypothetical protein [Brevibacterium litoralis]|uniref:hypothetical protein n=1 Tax=Brevibacterium litoralis TaxID=3138935 RepID=UPI0032ED6693